MAVRRSGSSIVVSLLGMRQLFLALQSVITGYYWRVLVFQVTSDLSHLVRGSSVMGLQWATLVLGIYAMTSVSAFLSSSPIVVFDPLLTSHQKYAEHLASVDQHSSGSKNRLISRVKPTSPDYLEEHEPERMPALEKEQGKFPGNERLHKKLGPYLRNSPPAVSSDNFLTRRQLQENAHISPRDSRQPINYQKINPEVSAGVSDDREHQNYNNYLGLSPSDNRVEKNHDNQQSHADGYKKVIPVVNPEVQRVNPVRRNRINNGNADIRLENSMEKVGDINYQVQNARKKSEATPRDPRNCREINPEKNGKQQNYNNYLGLNTNSREATQKFEKTPINPGNYREINPEINAECNNQKHQNYNNYLGPNLSGTRVKKNHQYPQMYEEIYESGYGRNPAINPEVQRVNSVRRNRINPLNAKIPDAGSGEEAEDRRYKVETKKKKSNRTRRPNQPEVRPEYEYGDRRDQVPAPGAIYYDGSNGDTYVGGQFGERDNERRPERNPKEDIDLEPMIKQEVDAVGDKSDGQNNLRRQDVGGGEDEPVEVVAGSVKKEKHREKAHSQKHEEGGGEEDHEDHLEAGGEKEKKGYDSHHEHEKGEKGHHDKEVHDKHYDEKEGKANKHSDDSSYYKHYDSGEKKEKESAFDEDGKFNKGHSTKGNHVVHKKDEFEKLEEFYDESHDEDEHEKDEGYHHKFEKEHGGSEKSGHFDAAEEVGEHGKKSEHEKGHHYKDKKGHDEREGEDKHHETESKYGKKGGYQDGKKWEYKKGR